MNKELIKSAVSQTVTKMPEWDFCESGVVVDGKEYKLTPWRFDIRLNGLHFLSAETKSLRKNCSYKALVATHKSEDIAKLLFTEIDVCQWLLNDKIKSVYSFMHEDKMCSVMLKTYGDVLCQMDISTTLSDESKPVVKHEIVGKEGMITDRSINEQIPVDSVYLFKDDEKYPEAMTDTNLHTIGLTPLENQILDNIVYFIMNGRAVLSPEDEDYILKVIEAINKSAASGEKVFLGEEK